MHGSKGFLVIFLILLLVPILLSGCAAFKATTQEIREDPAAFQAEAAQVTAGLNTVAIPLGGPIGGGAAVGIGYALCFLRRLYTNWRKEEAKKRAKLAADGQ